MSAATTSGLDFTSCPDREEEEGSTDVNNNTCLHNDRAGADKPEPEPEELHSTSERQGGQSSLIVIAPTQPPGFIVSKAS